MTSLEDEGEEAPLVLVDEVEQLRVEWSARIRPPFVRFSQWHAVVRQVPRDEGPAEMAKLVDVGQQREDTSIMFLDELNRQVGPS